MYLYPNITGLCWEQFCFFLRTNWDVPHRWLVRSTSPSTPKYFPSAFSTGPESRLKTHSESRMSAGAWRIFRLLIQIATDQWW